MAYGNRYVYRGKPEGSLATSGNTESTRPITSTFYEALVVDVIVDQFHPSYSPDGYNVGTIKVRLLSKDNSIDEELLDWADPIETTIQEMPLLGELVLVQKVLGNYFYSRKVNLTRMQQEQGMLNLNKQLSDRPNRSKSQITSNNEEIEPIKHKFGEYFKPDSRVRQLKHFEGDMIIQGRMGHSVRLGSSQIDPSSKGMAPNIILRTGQAKDAENTACTTKKVFGLILEDVNKDASSIWMTADQVVPYEPTIIDAGSFYRSLQNTPQQYDGASIIMNSDRIILGSKKTHIMLLAHDEIYLNSFKNTSIDTDSNIILTANIDIRNLASRNIDNIADKDYTISVGQNVSVVAIKNTSVVSDKIFVGSVNNTDEPLVGGTSLAIFLARFIEALLGLPSGIGSQTQANSRIDLRGGSPKIASTAHVITPMGPGQLNPAIQQGLVKLYNELKTGGFKQAPFNSEDNYVMLQNEEPKVELNEFKSGKVNVIENNTWLLSDSYYKVS